MSHRRTFLLAVTLSLAAVPLVAGDEVPFKGSALSQAVSFDPTTMSAVFEITGGNVTHLGSVTGVGTVYYHPVYWYPIGADQTLIAANGDELYITATPTAYAITGGTGRFAGASGSGSMSVEVVGDPADEIVLATWKGTIDY